MKVILQQNVQKLGKAGDIVESSNGYFRNYLQPRKLAVLATDGSLKKREEDLDMLRKKAEATHQEAVALGEKIKALESIVINVKTGDTGKLYGKITNKEIAHVLHEKLGTEVDKRLIKTTDDISALGSYKVIVKLSPEVQADFMVDVLPEGVTSKPKPKVEEPKAEEAESEVGEEVTA